jgi:radical SAM superfamily enzyme YgiQ (UPF0313 family)
MNAHAEYQPKFKQVFMKKLDIFIIDLIAKAPTNALFERIMSANFASIMPQVIATWCEQAGHNVTLITYTGFEKLEKEVPAKADVVFISSFTQAALMAYALSNRFRKAGAVTVLGGPHARCYPQDALKYFDYVLGFTNKQLIMDVLSDCSPHRPEGVHWSAGKQPAQIPGVKERWKFIETTLKKAPFLKIVPMVGSMGCPYTCSFCIDSTVPYQPLDNEVIKEDLRFLLTKFKRPQASWHDPNFGIRFDESLTAIEEAAPPGSFEFIAESSLSLLSEEHCIRLKRAGFKAILPGIESWFDLGNKSRTGKKQGEEKVRQVSEQVNMIQKHIPYIQTNFVLGLDSEEGSVPYELTKAFVDKSPGAFPGYSLLTAFGQAAPLNLEYQRSNRVLPVPFAFLNNNQAMNVKPLNYSWPEFYDHVIDLVGYTFSRKAIYKRFKANPNFVSKSMNVVRAISSEGYGRLRYHKEVRRRLKEDRPFRAYMEGETAVLPSFFLNMLKKELGKYWEWLPEGAIDHEPNAYLKSTAGEDALVAAN